jgi:hypothetical protein
MGIEFQEIGRGVAFQMALTKIVSGGQTAVDRGALDAARISESGAAAAIVRFVEEHEIQVLNVGG